MPSLNMPVQRLKVAILPLDLPRSGPVTHSGEILTTGKSQGKKPDWFSLNDDMDVEKEWRFWYAAWNVREQGERKEELEKILKENNIKISVNTEGKKKFLTSDFRLIWILKLFFSVFPRRQIVVGRRSGQS